MSYRNVNAASPANLSSSQGNLSKVRRNFFHVEYMSFIYVTNYRVTNQVHTIDRVLAQVQTTYQPTLTRTQVHRVVHRQLVVIMGESYQQIRKLRFFQVNCITNDIRMISDNSKPLQLLVATIII